MQYGFLCSTQPFYPRPKCLDQSCVFVCAHNVARHWVENKSYPTIPQSQSDWHWSAAPARWSVESDDANSMSSHEDRHQGTRSLLLSLSSMRQDKTKSYKIRQMLQTDASLATVQAAELICLGMLDQRCFTDESFWFLSMALTLGPDNGKAPK